jgi:hypothetical protein
MFTLCVTEPVLISVSRRMSVLPTVIEKSTPWSSESGAVTMVGRVAKPPDALYR